MTLLTKKIDICVMLVVSAAAIKFTLIKRGYSGTVAVKHCLLVPQIVIQDNTRKHTVIVGLYVTVALFGFSMLISSTDFFCMHRVLNEVYL